MKILIADDDFSTRKVIGALLRQYKHTCLEAANGAEAVVRVVTEKPDLVLMDLNMPILNGTDAIIAIRSLPNTVRVPIICLSGCIEEKERAELAGADDVLEKPIYFKKLLDKIENFHISLGRIAFF